MAFDTDGDGGSLVEDAEFWTVRVSTATALGKEQPKFGNFEVADRLHFLGAFYGSSIGGQSYARLKLILGDPDGDGLQPEDAAFLKPGDRVIIAKGEKPMWAGIMTAAEIGIEGESEHLIYRLAGPEWQWGTDDARGGAGRVINGQLRRSAAADDTWAANPDTVTTAWEKLVNATGQTCVFSPDGQKNMTTEDVGFPKTTGVTPKGRAFEIPDRRIGVTERAAFWTVDKAVQMLVQGYDVPADTGIDWPDWGVANLVLGINALGSSRVLRNLSVEGMGLWAALKAVLQPDAAFYVDPRPSKVDAWGGFKIVFFSRATGDPAYFYLGARGQNVVDVPYSLTRLQAAKTVEKTVNRVAVQGTAFRHLDLQYCGFKTISLTPPYKKLALQHGWTKADGELGMYGDQDAVEEATIDKTAGKLDEYRARYVVGGTDFLRYRHVFRLFVWNESGEWRDGGSDGANPQYTQGGTKQPLPWFAPDLTNIADGADLFDPIDHLGDYVRRRRRFLDTPYLDPGMTDGYRRLPPTLWIGAADTATTIDPPADKWQIVPNDRWQVDPDRGAIWMLAEDLAKWQPLFNQRLAAEGKVQDERTYLTLLWTGKLRLRLSASVETDWALERVADRQNLSGLPHVRSVYVRAPADFIVTKVYSGPFTPLGTLTAKPLDQSADAAGYAAQARESGQDETLHASIMATASWLLQPIGTMVSQIRGDRPINLTSTSGRGAQIVAAHLDPEAMAMEYLTETAAFELRQMDRIRVAARRRALKRQPLQRGGGIPIVG